MSVIDSCPTCKKVYMFITSASSIIFVHGFGGHYTDTWTSESEGVYWPRDFLKSKLERARIISYHYDAEISRFLPQDDGSASPCARELLIDLTKLRADQCQVRNGFFFSGFLSYSLNTYSGAARLFLWFTPSAVLLSKR